MSKMHHRRKGYPFGSLVDFAPDPMGRKLLYTIEYQFTLEMVTYIYQSIYNERNINFHMFFQNLNGFQNELSLIKTFCSKAYVQVDNFGVKCPL